MLLGSWMEKDRHALSDRHARPHPLRGVVMPRSSKDVTRVVLAVGREKYVNATTPPASAREAGSAGSTVKNTRTSPKNPMLDVQTRPVMILYHICIVDYSPPCYCECSGGVAAIAHFYGSGSRCCELYDPMRSIVGWYSDGCPGKPADVSTPSSID